jgi:hypothetical protein
MHDEPFKVGKPVFWNLSKYYFADKTDYAMDASKVLGMLPKQLESNDDEMVIQKH